MRKEVATYRHQLMNILCVLAMVITFTSAITFSSYLELEIQPGSRFCPLREQTELKVITSLTGFTLSLLS